MTTLQATKNFLHAELNEASQTYETTNLLLEKTALFKKNWKEENQAAGERIAILNECLSEIHNLQLSQATPSHATPSDNSNL